MGKAKKKYETRWELDIWDSHAYKFSCEKDGGGEGGVVIAKKNLLYWHLMAGYPIGYFLNVRKTVILLEEYEYEGCIGQGSSLERGGDPERWIDFK